MHGALPYKDEKRLAAFNIADGMMKKLFDRIYSKFEREQQYYSLARTESANDSDPSFLSWICGEICKTWAMQNHKSIYFFAA